ncbi:EAL domain-containing protein [Amorphus sp. MBR-141]
MNGATTHLPLPGRRAARTLGLAAGCFLLPLISIAFADLPGRLAMVAASSALATGLILRWHYEALAIRIAVAFAAIFCATMITGTGLATPLVTSAAHGLEIAAAVLVLKLAGWRYDRVPTIRSFCAGLVVVATLAPVAGGALAASLLPHGGWLTFFLTWWCAGLIGAIGVLPMALTFRTSLSGPPMKMSDCATPEFLGLLALAVCTTLVSVRFLPYPYIYIGLPILLAAALLGACRTSAVIVITIVTYLIEEALFPDPTADLHLMLAGYVCIAIAVLPPFLYALQRDALVFAEDEARSKGYLFRRAMHDSAIGMAIVDLDGRLLEVNQALCSILGYDPDELTRTQFRDLTFPEDVAASGAVLKSLFSGKTTHSRLEKRYIRKDGSIVWCMVSVSLIRNETTDAPLHFVTQIEDVNARKLADEAIAESENRWRFALQSGRQAVWELNLKTGKTYRSPEWYSMLGYKEGDVPTGAEDFLQLIHPDDRQKLIASDRAMLEGRRTISEVEVRFRHKDGRWVWILDRGRIAEYDAMGEPVLIIGTHTNISRRKQREEEIRIANERIALAVEAADVGVWELDTVTGSVTWAQGMHELYGLAPGTFDGTRETWATLLHPDDAAEASRRFNEGLEKGGRIEVDFRIIRPDGATRYIRALAEVIADADGRPMKVIGTQWDTTDERALAEELYEEKERLRITLHSIGDAVITTDADLKVTFMNPIAETLSGWELRDAQGMDLADVFRVFDDETNLPVPSPVEASMQSMAPIYLQDGAVLLTRSGTRLHIQDSAAPVRAPNGAVIGAVLVFQDVTRTRMLQKELVHAAHTDSLTGLPNRLAFEQSLTSLCAEARTQSARHVLCFIDLDRFKIVNDSAGHSAGDAMLVDIGRLLTSTLRDGDLVARIGGDEFALLLPDCSLERAREVCEHLVNVIRNFVFHWDGHVYDIGASIGITEISGTHPEPAELMQEADVACYTAKSAGRGQVSVYRPDKSDAERHHREINVAAKLRMAIDSNRMMLFGQDIIALHGAPGADGRHIEILIRMRGESGELLAPGAFIPAAERHGMMAGIDRWVIAEVLQGNAQAFHDNPQLSVSINLSANSLDDPFLWPFVHDQLTYAEIAGDRICFEITETALINNLAAATFFARSANQYGCRISLDDFGVGLSSFSYLKNFRVDELKIDGSFIRQIEENNADTQIVEAIISVGKALGIATVAEWVEGPETLEIVKRLGADRAQGYYISPPKPLGLLLSEKSPAERIGRVEGLFQPGSDS